MPDEPSTPTSDEQEGEEEKACKQVPEVDNSGRTLFGVLLSAASIAAAAYNSYRAVQIAMQEYELATKYWYLADAWLNIYKNVYAPIEDVIVDEASNLPEEEPEYDVARGRARVSALIHLKGHVRPQILKTSKYCSGKREEIITQFASAVSSAVAVADGLGYRNERAKIEARNEVRFKKMLSAAKLGRNIVANNVSLAGSVAGIYGDLADQAWAGVAGAGYALGYITNRRETNMPRTAMEVGNPAVPPTVTVESPYATQRADILEERMAV